jgi:hypothetical protein
MRGNENSFRYEADALFYQGPLSDSYLLNSYGLFSARVPDFVLADDTAYESLVFEFFSNLNIEKEYSRFWVDVFDVGMTLLPFGVSIDNLNSMLGAEDLAMYPEVHPFVSFSDMNARFNFISSQLDFGLLGTDTMTSYPIQKRSFFQKVWGTIQDSQRMNTSLDVFFE